MLERGVQMRFCFESHYMREVAMIDVSVHSKQSFEDYFYYFFEILGEWNTWLVWKQNFIR